MSGEGASVVLLDEEVHAVTMISALPDARSVLATDCPLVLGVVIGVYGLIAGLPLLSSPCPSIVGFMRSAEATTRPDSTPSGSSKENTLELWLYGCGHC